MRAMATVFYCSVRFPRPRLTLAEESNRRRAACISRFATRTISSRKLLGERWYGLVKLQEWTDATGKFHTRPSISSTTRT